MPYALPSTTLSRTLPFLLLASLALGACGDKLKGGAAPVLTFDPDPPAWQFPKVRPGDNPNGIDKEVTVANEGEGTLKLAKFHPDFNGDYNLYFYRNGDRAHQLEGVVGGANKLVADKGDLLDIAPHENVTFVLNYKPTVEGAATGSFSFITNDGLHGSATIDIVSEEGSPEISVAPNSLDFGRVATGDETEAQTVTVTNLGQLVLDMQGASLSGNGFSAFIGDTDIIADPSPLTDPDGDGEDGLAPGKSFEIGVKFKNVIDGPADGVLSLLSNDPNAARVDVKLTANGASPCIRVSPEGDEGLSFGGVPINGHLQKPITIESCGGQPLRIDSIKMTDDSDSGIALVDESVPTLPALMPAMSPGQPLPNRNIKLQCSPTESKAYGGWVEVKSNDPINGSVRVKVTCLGVLNACPRPAVVNDEFNVAPLDSVVLDATPSTDEDGPNGKPLKYRWEVTEAPEGSSSYAVERLSGNPQSPLSGATPDDESTPRAVFFVDMLGTYTLKLHVVDNLDQDAPSENCPEPVATITINSTSSEDVHVEMSWDTPGDANQTDGRGSDVDLHMLHPRGTEWGQILFDCYYAQPNPDWGVRGVPTDDPTLDLDDVDGAGPENITLSDPEDTAALGQPYRVGVDYYRAEKEASFDTYGPSNITVKIYLGGQLAWQNDQPRELTHTHDFWEVAQIIWTTNDHRVRVVNQVHPL